MFKGVSVCCRLGVGTLQFGGLFYGAEGDLGKSEEGVRSPNHVCTQQRGGQAPYPVPLLWPLRPVLSFPPSSLSPTHTESGSPCSSWRWRNQASSRERLAQDSQPEGSGARVLAGLPAPAWILSSPRRALHTLRPAWGGGGDGFLGWAAWDVGHKRPSVCPGLCSLALPCSGSWVGVQRQAGQRGPPATSMLTWGPAPVLDPPAPPPHVLTLPGCDKELKLCPHLGLIVPALSWHPLRPKVLQLALLRGRIDE